MDQRRIFGLAVKASRLAALALALAAPAHGQLCGDPDGNGHMTLTDGVVILGAAAGLATACTAETCDMDGNGGITLTDGVAALRGAAGLDGCRPPASRRAPRLRRSRGPVARVRGSRDHVPRRRRGGVGDGRGRGRRDDPARRVRGQLSRAGSERHAIGHGRRRNGHVSRALRGRPRRQSRVFQERGDGDGRRRGRNRMVLQGSGVAEGTIQGVRFRCTGPSTAVFERLGSSQAAANPPRGGRLGPSRGIRDRVVHPARWVDRAVHDRGAVAAPRSLSGTRLPTVRTPPLPSLCRAARPRGLRS